MKKHALALGLGLISLSATCIGFADAQTAVYKVPTYKISCLKSIKQFDEVLFLMQKRLSVMHEVARYKWNAGLSVDSMDFEQEILAAEITRAESAGISVQWAEVYLRAQIDAAKLLQNQDFAKWTAENHGPFETVADLQGEIVPYVQSLTEELIQRLAAVYPEMTEAEKCCLTIQAPMSRRYFDELDEGVWNIAVWPLRTVFYIPR